MASFSCKCLPIKNAFKSVSQWFKPGSDGHGKSPGGHRGIDFAFPKGTPIYAVQDGKVSEAKWAAWHESYGNAVAISHGNNIYTFYAHMSKICCKKGQSVLAGQKIGEVGTTGNSTGNHLHFEINLNGKFTETNPKPYLQHLNSSYAYDDSTSGDYTEEGMVSGNVVNFSQSIQILNSSDNFKWLSDIEDTSNSVPDDKQDSFEETVKHMQEAIDKMNSTKSSGDGALDLIASTASSLDEGLNTLLYGSEGKVYKDRGYKVTNGTASGESLAQYPSLVEAPLICVEFPNGNKIGTFPTAGDSYPNYIESMSVSKINGKINQYTIVLIHQIRVGEDPNFIDELLSSINYYRNSINILYGDSQTPAFMYKEEEATITESTVTESVSGRQLRYEIKAIATTSSTFYKTSVYPAKKAKPSSVMYGLLSTNSDFRKAFPGMNDIEKVASKGLIPTTDVEVSISKMTNISVLDYLNYLTTCMTSADGNSTYQINYLNDNEMGGAYFKITEVNKNSTTTSNVDYWEIDVGYPSSVVLNYNVSENVYWPAVYEYNDAIDGQWDYYLDEKGLMNATKSLNLTKNHRWNKHTVTTDQWWTQVTEYPITASLEIKGLIRPIVLGGFIKVNTLFYGESDIGSGLFIVTAQNDTLSGSGYRTTLTLLRVGDTSKIYG